MARFTHYNTLKLADSFNSRIESIESAFVDYNRAARSVETLQKAVAPSAEQLTVVIVWRSTIQTVTMPDRWPIGPTGTSIRNYVQPCSE